MSLLDQYVVAVSTDAEYADLRARAETAMRRCDFTAARELTARMDAVADAIGKRLKNMEKN